MFLKSTVGTSYQSAQSTIPTLQQPDPAEYKFIVTKVTANGFILIMHITNLTKIMND